jgi:putative endonuclease
MTAMTAFTYMLRCRDGSYYVGSTNGELEKRIAEHAAGAYGGYTSSRRPLKLVWSESFVHIADAIAAERKIKGWSRAKKEALVAADWERIKILARRKGGR